MDFAKYYDRNTFRDLLTENKCKPRIGLDTSYKKRRRFRQRKQTIIIGPRGFRGFKGKDGSGQPEPVIGNPPTIVLIGNSIIEHDVNTAWNEPGVIALLLRMVI